MTRTRKLPEVYIVKAYIGTKIISAEPQAAQSDGPNHKAGDPGYRVVYEDDYVSWSPKDVFERNYREVTMKETKLVVDAADYIDWPGD